MILFKLHPKCSYAKMLHLFKHGQWTLTETLSEKIEAGIGNVVLPIVES